MVDWIQRAVLMIVFTFLNLQQRVHAPNTAHCYLSYLRFPIYPSHSSLPSLHVATGVPSCIIYYLSNIPLSVPFGVVLFFSHVINIYKIALFLQF